MDWKLERRERYALIQRDDVDAAKHRGTFYIGPRHVKHHKTKKFVEFSYVTAPNFASEKDCRVFAQNSHVAIEVYDYYTKLFDPDYETVSVYDERFAVQYEFKAGTWRDVDGYNPTIQVIPLDDGVEIKRILDTDYGAQTLEISHIVRTGVFLKHKIVFTNKTSETKTFRVVMKLAGIVNSKIKCHDEEFVIDGEKHKIAPFFFAGEDNQHLKLTEYLWSLGVTNEETLEWTPKTLKDIIFDIHAKGCKADIVIGNYPLAENESLLIDPTTDTWQVSASGNDVQDKGTSGDLNGALGTTDFTTTDVFCAAGYQYTGWGKPYQYSGFRWTGVNIPQGSTITSAHLKICAKDQYLTNTGDSEARIYGEDADNPNAITSHTDFRGRTRTSAYVDWDVSGTWTEDVWYTSPPITTVIQEIVNRASYEENALTLFWGWRTTISLHRLRTGYSYDSTSLKAPKLEVTWTSGATYTKTWQTDILFKKLGITKTAPVDVAFKKSDITKTLSLNTLFKKIIEKTFGLDSAFMKAVIKQKHIDALFKKLGITETFTIDVDFQKTQEIQRQVDALFRKTLTVQKQVDVLFQKLGILKQFEIDVDFLKQDIVKSFAIDAYFGAVVTYTIQKQIDALFKKLGIEKPFSLDVDFRKTHEIHKAIDVFFKKTVALSKQINVLFQKVDILKSFGVDVTLQKKDVPKTLTVDSLFQATKMLSKQVDVLFKQLGVTRAFTVDAWFGTVGAVTYTKTLSIDVIFSYKVKLPTPLGITLNGQLVFPLKKEVWIGEHQ